MKAIGSTHNGSRQWVTGEAIDIDRKNQPAVRDVRLDIPVCLNANGLARIRDNTDAVFNRSIVLNMTNVIDLEAAHAARVAAGTGEQSIGMAIFERGSPWHFELGSGWPSAAPQARVLRHP